MSERARLSKPERQEAILTEVRTSAAIRISDLARRLGVAGETIRRDLAELGESGLITRTYGGATISPLTAEPVVAERGLLLVEERARIARRCVDLVPDRQVVMIDGGSTTQEVARQLAISRRELTVITNATGIATLTGANPTFRVILCPGVYDLREGSVLGEETVEFVARYNADLAIIGASGMTVDGPCDAHSGAAAVKRAMLRQAEAAVLVADRTKFGRRGIERICPWDQVRHLVTDGDPPPPFESPLAHAGTELHIAIV
jgi:DeoR/GlpR family transcriptional regulator of sugar metabolism